ncbi:ABC transporter ATP-binding protein [Anaeromyxobacter oryzae]|uniref:ABC transporter ATP-binding protein n=1 Tax=Anaeromyxobacter oryzae TaxID=2918170 RepID=A0ABN6MRZ8_9BACT|nr:ABC transporter ATP-binding protein [Anaeromyxobacter oryzae]BDG03762.1 ABC transporter ATP-binding protein [Anaeromyxobacter oryzae]
MLAIEARGLAKRYTGPLGRKVHDALRGVDLAVPRGTAFGLIGPNGAGKTTFVKTLLGVVRPTAGAVRLLGGDPEDPRIRARVGYMPERLRLSPAWTPLEILASVARLKGAPLPRPRALALLEEVGIAHAAARRVGGFSKGMRQRVGLAAALVGDPELLVLDEPTDGLDPIGRVEVRALLARRLAAGATLFLNSHLLAETERICGRIGILVEGRLAREGPLEALTATSAEWLVRFEGDAPAPALAEAGFTAGGDGRWRFAGEPEPLNAALDRARAAGALVVELQADGKDLEVVLAEALRAGREAA